MKKSFIPLCLTFGLALLNACSTTKTTTSSLKALDGKWLITEVDGQTVTPRPGDREAFMGFNVKEQRVYGCTGCNRLTGGLQADAAKGTISFGQTGSTRMMCENMETERKVLDAMSKVERYKRQDASANSRRRCRDDVEEEITLPIVLYESGPASLKDVGPYAILPAIAVESVTQAD